jgi:hypothetical protein
MTGGRVADGKGGGGEQHTVGVRVKYRHTQQEIFFCFFLVGGKRRKGRDTGENWRKSQGKREKIRRWVYGMAVRQI